MFEIAVGSNKIRVIPRDVQVDPVKDHPIHVDFLRIGKDGVIRVAVPVRFANHAASPGLKRGGVLNIVRHEVEVFCPYDRIPAFFEIDLAGLEIGRSIHISSVTMPDGVRSVIANRDFTVATIAGAKNKDDEEAAAAGAEGAAAAPAGDAKARSSCRRCQGRCCSRQGRRSGCWCQGSSGCQARRQEVRRHVCMKGRRPVIRVPAFSVMDPRDETLRRPRQSRQRIRS